MRPLYEYDGTAYYEGDPISYESRGGGTHHGIVAPATGRVKADFARRSKPVFARFDGQTYATWIGHDQIVAHDRAPRAPAATGHDGMVQ